MFRSKVILIAHLNQQTTKLFSIPFIKLHLFNIPTASKHTSDCLVVCPCHEAQYNTAGSVLQGQHHGP
jgi:Rieske Fe-S protein